LDAENDGPTHFPPDVVFAGGLQDHRFTDRKHGSDQIARHPEFWPLGHCKRFRREPNRLGPMGSVNQHKKFAPE
jgi:hypothetical protein